MKHVLANLALIHAIKFCQDNQIDCSGTHLVKVGRGFKYRLVRDKDEREVVSVQFHKSQVPTYTFPAV